MELVLFCHPSFHPSHSMPRFAQMLREAFEARGHRVALWSPRAVLFKRFSRGGLAKWAGYVDQFLLFPFWVRRALVNCPPNTLFVFCDQALGPWMPLVEKRPHVVHVHDLLALRSALGEFPENPTALSGRLYQRLIRRGFRHARHFISISRKTRDDLQRVGRVTALTSDVVYNGLNFPFSPLSAPESDRVLEAAGLRPPPQGMILHVGGAQWYKNLPGVIALYGEYARRTVAPLPLLCVSPDPNTRIRSMLAKLPPKAEVRFVKNLDSVTLQALYSRATAFLFPSLAEGFGWPLIEAQACGCPVITTAEPPMNEVAGDGCFFLPRLTSHDDLAAWAAHGADVLQSLLDEAPADKIRRRESGLAWVKRFDAGKAIDGYLAIYERVLDIHLTPREVAPRLNQSTQA